MNEKRVVEGRLLGELKKLINKEGIILAGFPRFPRIFGRDSLITSWELLDFDPSIARRTLEFLSKYQGKRVNDKREEEPGKILHEIDPKKKENTEYHFPFPYYGSIDSTPLFLILLSFYFDKTKDEKFLRSCFANILEALNWIISYGDEDSDLFIEYERRNLKGLFHQGWKDGFNDHLHIKPPVAIVEVQGYQYLALRKAAEIFAFLGEGKFEKSLLERAEKLKEKFNKRFWMRDKNYYALALDGLKKQRKAITSNPGHLLFTGVCDKDKEKLVVKRLFQKDLWTPYGIRTHSAKEPDFDPLSYHLGSVWPHDNWIIAQGLKERGYKKEYQKVKNAILKAYKELGLIPEFYGVVRGKITLKTKKKPCYLQAWSIGALINFLNS